MLDDPTPDVVLSKFIQSSTPVQLDATIGEIDLILSTLDDSALQSLVLDQFLCGYDPVADGLTIRAWLTDIRGRASTHVATLRSTSG